MKVKLFGLALLAALAAAAPSTGAAPKIFARALAVGQMQATTIHATTGAAILDQITIRPGGNFGWHTHGASVAVVVTQGTLTVFDPTVAGCKPFKVGKGQSFVEPANHVHLARNDGTRTVKLYAFYLGVPQGALVNKPADEPAGCSA
jgi:quercetin dioxygenase-like cupin family protein